MRILILAIPRSGSSTMFKSFQNELKGYTSFYEPWHIRNDTDVIDIDSNPNLIIKSLIYQQPYLSQSEEIKSMSYKFVNSFKFYEYLIPKFDKVILLNRIDGLSTAESYHHALSTANWFGRWESTNKTVNPQVINLFKILSSRIKKISERFDLKIWNYEDLFCQQNESSILAFIEEVGIDINDVDSFLECYNLKNKLRIV